MSYTIDEDYQEYIYSSADEDGMSDEHDYYGNCNNSDFGGNLSDADDLDDALYSCHYFQNQETEWPEEEEEEESEDDICPLFSSEAKENLMSIPQKRVRMVIWSDLQPTMKQQLSEVVEVLGIPSSAAAILMREFRWSKEQLLEEFTINPDRVKRLCGVYNRCITKKTAEQSSARKKKYSMYSMYSRCSTPEKMHFCEICFEDGGFAPEDMISMPCGHEFCRDCWRGFVNTMLREGTECLNYTCPQVGCNEKVTEEEVKKAAPQLLPAYKRHQLRAFVETNMYSRWCPGIGCQRVAVGNPLLSVSEKVSCSDCDTMFCFKCGEEPHSPMTCHDLIRWKDKCKDESETAKWIMVHTKTCPKCKTRIEKNGGCNHMTCRKCKHEFCWICMKNWTGHKTCNTFVAADDQTKMFDSKRELERYLHYYERYQAHDMAQKLSEKARQTFIDEELETNVQSNEFLKDAHDQLVECRRVLKYTYSFAYLNMCDTSSNNEVEKRTFEYHQGMLERFTENLSELCETEFEKIDRTEVINLTRVLQDFVENILTHVEESVGDCTPSDSTNASRVKQLKHSSISFAKNLLQRDP